MNQLSPEELTIGKNVEFEHGTKIKETNITNDDKKMKGQKAWTYLKEFLHYYTRLKKMGKQVA